MKDTLIVPIQLNDIPSHQNMKSNTSTLSESPACHLKIKHAEVTFHNGIDKYILNAVLAAVSKYAR